MFLADTTEIEQISSHIQPDRKLINYANTQTIDDKQHLPALTDGMLNEDILVSDNNVLQDGQLTDKRICAFNTNLMTTETTEMCELKTIQSLVNVGENSFMSDIHKNYRLSNENFESNVPSTSYNLLTDGCCPIESRRCEEVVSYKRNVFKNPNIQIGNEIEGNSDEEIEVEILSVVTTVCKIQILALIQRKARMK